MFRNCEDTQIALCSWTAGRSVDDGCEVSGIHVSDLGEVEKTNESCILPRRILCTISASMTFWVEVEDPVEVTTYESIDYKVD